MKYHIKKVVISGGREVGGLDTFARSLAKGFAEIGIASEVRYPREIVMGWKDLRDPQVLKILSTTSVFAAPFARNAICVAHGFPRADAQGWVKLVAILASFKLASKFGSLVAVSDYVAVHLRSIFNLRVDAVIKNPLAAPFLELIDTQPEVPNYITFVGRLHPVKNVHRLLPVIQSFLAKHPDHRACLIGDGELRVALEESVRDDPRIEFKGSLCAPDVRAWLRKTRVFVSGCETEALGIAYLEALSQGCAVVMPASGGGLEIAPRLIGEKIFLFPLSFDAAEIESALASAAMAPRSSAALDAFKPAAIATEYMRLSDTTAGVHSASHRPTALTQQTMPNTSTTPRGLSCLLSVYAKDDPAHLLQAIHSVLQQTLPPDELVVIEDGPLPIEVRTVLEKCKHQVSTVYVSLPKNVGRGLALAQAFDTCAFDLVAMMDADDIARPERFERQERYMRAHPEVILLGGSIEEFRDQPGDLGRYRHAPQTDAAVRDRARTRNPFNQMTVVFRKQVVQAAGGYRHNPGFEDYDLWLRMLQQPGHAMNLTEVLVDVRVGNGMLNRRRGWSYVKTEISFLMSCCRQGLISTPDMLKSAAVRIPARLVPASLLEMVYERLLRKRT